ncbi:hypothetical protein GP486_007905 [Trichoglossum hirsutum]|uniref:Uncharacterized protein n=1 Tax=Trichoglossum hirsutum TaxID=265104 RepID=A0A9P8IJ51_9PEZI|nr:hypothetical protein GP486_007905 [Trichoglossum hirsutum]
MDDTGAQDRGAKGSASDNVELTNVDTSGSPSGGRHEVAAVGTAQYRVYKIRWFGLAQLVLMNIVVSWDDDWGRGHVVDWNEKNIYRVVDLVLAGVEVVGRVLPRYGEQYQLA